MFRSVRARHDSFPLATPFRISRGVKTVADVITVEIVEQGLIGRGEGVPYPRYGETIAGALAQINEVQSALEQGADRATLQQIMPPGAARNAVDCALWDLEAQRAGQAVTALLDRPAIGATPTAITVSLDTPEAMGLAAAALKDAPLIKVKVDQNDPIACIRAVREAAPLPQMIVDPNESWTMAEVAGLQDELLALRVDLLEQPLPAGEDEALDGFTPLIPLAADESAHVADDIAQLCRRYQVINIKLDKTGGLTGAIALADEAERAGLGLMTGSMICSSLSIAPALVIAARSRFVDLDGPLWLSQDRDGGVRSTNGVLTPPEPGFWGNA